jgi:sulfatase modifying factor 1
MIAVPGGRFRMGSAEHCSEGTPIHDVAVPTRRWIDRHAVTNVQFANFVAATATSPGAQSGCWMLLSST